MDLSHLITLQRIIPKTRCVERQSRIAGPISTIRFSAVPALEKGLALLTIILPLGDCSSRPMAGSGGATAYILGRVHPQTPIRQVRQRLLTRANQEMLPL